MHILFDNENLRVSAILNDYSSITLCFVGIGHEVDALDVQTEEFFSLSKSSTVFFIIDKKRTWGNGIDFNFLRELINPYISGRSINSIGNSMGGFLAILATCFFPISTAVAFVPQFSVSKRIIPEESRFDSYVKNINVWKYESLENSFNDVTQYYILAGISDIENHHLLLFPFKKNIQKIFFLNPEFNHKVAQQLKALGILGKVINDCFNKKSGLEIKRNWSNEQIYTTFIS